MCAMWGIHNDAIPAGDLLAGGFVSIGWERVGDLTHIGDDQAAMRSEVLDSYPRAKPGAIPVWAGVLRRFGFTVREGDLVVAPDKSDSTINIGRITGPYRYDTETQEHPHRRPVHWLETGIPRTRFSRAALNEIGSALTLFQIRNHAGEFRAAAGTERQAVPPNAVEETTLEDEGRATELAAEEPSAAKVQQYTVDFVLKALVSELSHEEFEHFVADLLRAMGYQARVTAYSRDGGVDVIAHRDPLGLEPPMIKVQVKHSDATRGVAEVNQLAGTLMQGEQGLFVTLGAYSTDAQTLERQKSELRLLAGNEVVGLVLQHYEALPERWQSRLPLRRVWVVDRDAEGR